VQVRVDKVADVPLDGQEAETSAPSGALGAVIELSVAHSEVLDATSGDIDFRVRLGDSGVAPSATGETCPADYRKVAEVEVEAGPAPAPEPAPASAPAPGSSSPSTRPAAAAAAAALALLACLMGALLL
jgi:hypothetical protein